MRRPRPLPPTLRSRPFTVAEALALGVTPAQLRTPTLRTPFRGVRVPADLPDTLDVRCRAALLVLPAGAVFSGRTAVALCSLPWALSAADVLEEPLHVAVAGPGDAPRARGLVAVQRRWASARLVLSTGLPVMHPAHLWCEASPDLPLVDAVALADAVRRRWASADAMAGAVRARAGAPDVVRLREVLAMVRYPVDSPMETRTRLLLVAAGLPEPVCGRPVVVDGGWIATPDLSWPQVRVALEYDGGHHRTDARQWAQDIRRRQMLEAHGWRVVVITAADVLRWPGQTVAMVAQVLRERGLTW